MELLQSQLLAEVLNYFNPNYIDESHHEFTRASKPICRTNVSIPNLRPFFIKCKLHAHSPVTQSDGAACSQGPLHELWLTI